MIAWMVYNKQDAKKNARYIDFYKEEGKKRAIEFQLIYTEDITFGVKNVTYELKIQDEIPKLPDFIVCRTIYPMLSLHFEKMGIPVFNNSFTARICNDKALTYQYVSSAGVPMVDTTFHRKEELDSIFLRHVNEPVVMKAVAGHGGSQVFLYDSKSEDSKEQEMLIRSGLNGCDFVVQPLTGSRHEDLRVYVIGNQIVASVLRKANTGFRSNFSLGGSVRLYELNEMEKEQVGKIIHLFDFGLVGIDFIIGDFGELIFNEIEDVVGARMLYQCSDYNLVSNYLDYICSKMNK